MHVFAASGGSFQFVLNEVLRRLQRECHVGLDEMDAFFNQNKHSVFERPVPDNLFSRRYNAEARSHFKGVAGETVVAVKTLFWTRGFTPFPSPIQEHSCIRTRMERCKVCDFR